MKVLPGAAKAKAVMRDSVSMSVVTRVAPLMTPSVLMMSASLGVSSTHVKSRGKNVPLKAVSTLALTSLVTKESCAQMESVVLQRIAPLPVAPKGSAVAQEVVSLTPALASTAERVVSVVMESVSSLALRSAVPLLMPASMVSVSLQAVYHLAVRMRERFALIESANPTPVI